MKYWGEILKDEKLDKLQKALLCRRIKIASLAKRGFSNLAIARYFEICPQLVEKILVESKEKEIPLNRISHENKIEELLDERDEELNGLDDSGLLKKGFLYAPMYRKSLHLVEEMYAINWNRSEIKKYYKEAIGKNISDYKIRKILVEGKRRNPRNIDHVQKLMEAGYNMFEIAEYLSVSKYVITKSRKNLVNNIAKDLSGENIIDNIEEAAKKQLYSLKNKERREYVYYYRVKLKWSEIQTAETLGISRSTVSSDLKHYFLEHPELADEKCEPKHRRRNAGRYDKAYQAKVADKEADIIKLRKAGRSIADIVRITKVKESDIIKYIRKNEADESGTLYKWKCDMIEKIMNEENKKIAVKELAVKLNMPPSFVSQIRKRNK